MPLEVELNFPTEQRFELREFGGFTDWKCNCPPGFFNEIENFDIEDNGSLCVRHGSTLACPDTPLTPSGNLRVERLACFKDKLLIFQGKRLYCKDATGGVTVVSSSKIGDAGADLFFEAEEDTCSDHDTWNEHLLAVDGECSQPVKIYCNELGDLTAKSMGLPRINGEPDLTTEFATDDSGERCNYVYAFYYCCQYQVASGKFFEDVGPITFVRIEDAPCFDEMGQAVNIANIPVLECPEGFHFNINNTRIHVYRTTNNGTTFFEVGTIPATQSTFSDGLQDDMLQNNQIIYNQGSSVQWTQAPPSEFIEVIDDVAWYAGRTCVDGVEFNNRLYQSIPGAPWSSPREFYIEFEGRINGLSQYARFPIVSVIDDCNRCKLYRVQGRLDIFGRDQLVPYVISDATAAINNNSFVRSETGLYFFGFGGSGIYRTDAYKIQKVTNPKCNFDDTYCDMIETPQQRKNVVGAYDKKRNRIYWGVSTIPGLAENNKMLVYHEHHNAFTWYSNGDNFRPSALTYDNETSTLIRGDSRGYIFEHNELQYTDPAVDETVADVAQWETAHIPFCLQTVPNDFGDCVTNKQVNNIYLRGKPETNATFQIESLDNGCERTTPVSCVEFKQADAWCVDEENPTWCGDPDGWCAGEECHMYKTRRFPCTRTMTKDKAIRICAKESVLECGTVDAAQITFDAVTGTFTKPTGVFTQDDIGREIELADGRRFTITAFSGNQAGVDLAGATLASGSYNWALFGYPKNERVCIDCMGFTYCVIGTVGGEFTAGESKALSWSQSNA